jgi:hypothetical protein
VTTRRAPRLAPWRFSPPASRLGDKPAFGVSTAKRSVDVRRVPSRPSRPVPLASRADSSRRGSLAARACSPAPCRPVPLPCPVATAGRAPGCPWLAVPSRAPGCPCRAVPCPWLAVPLAAPGWPCRPVPLAAPAVPSRAPGWPAARRWPWPWLPLAGRAALPWPAVARRWPCPWPAARRWLAAVALAVALASRAALAVASRAPAVPSRAPRAGTSRAVRAPAVPSRAPVLSCCFLPYRAASCPIDRAEQSERAVHRSLVWESWTPPDQCRTIQIETVQNRPHRSDRVHHVGGALPFFCPMVPDHLDGAGSCERRRAAHRRRTMRCM